ncbi:MAG TPA: hypothetical protein VF808_01955 [Ktedonobacterales bacterium]
MTNWHQNDVRGLAGKDAFEAEQMRRLNPFGRARLETAIPGQLTTGERMRAIWARLRTLFGRGRDDGAPES